jgi:uncharacterized protein
MEKLLLWSQKHPLLVLIILALCSAISITSLLDIKVDTSAEIFMMENDPARDYYHQSLKIFGSEQITIIMIKDPDIFSPEKLRFIQDLVYKLEVIEGVIKAESIFSIKNIKDQDGILNTSPLIDFLPETKDEALAVKKNGLANQILVDNLISKDGQTIAVNLYLETHPEQEDYLLNTEQAIEACLTPLKGKFTEIFQFGEPYIARSQTDALFKDMKTILPLAFLVLLITFVIMLRTVSAAILPFLTSVLSILFTFGFMGYFNIPITALTFSIPILILVIGSTEDIHILSEYISGIKSQEKNNQLKEGSENLDSGIDKSSKRDNAVKFMATRMGVVLMLTAITTVFGFSAIIVNKIIILKQFGIAATFALLINPLVTVMVAPVFLHYFGPVKYTAEKNTVLERLMKRTADLIFMAIKNYRRLIIIIIACLITAGMVLGFSVRVENNLIGNFKTGSPIIKRINTLNENLAGSATFTIRISGAEGDFLNPEILKQVEKLRTYVDTEKSFDKSITFTDYVKVIHREMKGGSPEYFKIPDSTQEINEYLLFLDQDDIASYVTSEYDELSIIVRHQIYSSTQLNLALAKLENVAKQVIPNSLEVHLTGQNILINRGVASIAKGQILGMFLITGAVFLVISFLFMNWKVGILSLIPNMFPISLNFAVMGLLDIPLNAGTCMVAAISIGIAIDDTIHLMSRYNQEMKNFNNQDLSLRESIRSEFLPVLSTSLALAIGFATLSFSDYVLMIHFGLLSALIMLFAFIGDMFVTPILLSSIQLITLWDILALKIRKNVLAKSSLLKNLHSWQVKKIILLGKICNFDERDLVVKQGEHGKTMYVILNGKAQVRVNCEETGDLIFSSEMGAGEIFGEIALLNPSPRTASIQAETKLKLIEFDWDSIERIKKYSPKIATQLLLNISTIIADRLTGVHKRFQE